MVDRFWSEILSQAVLFPFSIAVRPRLVWLLLPCLVECGEIACVVPFVRRAIRLPWSFFGMYLVSSKRCSSMLVLPVLS